MELFIADFTPFEVKKSAPIETDRRTRFTFKYPVCKFLVSAAILMSGAAVKAQCNFGIATAPSSTGCLKTEAEIRWTQTANATATGALLTKTGGGNNWNAGAVSGGGIGDYGYAETVVTQTDRERLFGLNSTENGYSQNAVNFAFHLRNNGTLRIREGGSNRGNAGNYNSGDTLRVLVENGTVSYLKNSEVLYVSNAAPDFPLFVKTVFRHSGGEIAHARLGNFGNGLLTATLHEGDFGTYPQYQWTVNGAPEGGSTETFDASDLQPGDEVSCTLTDTDGCAAGSTASNALRIISFDDFTPANFYITATPSVSGCHIATEEIIWNSASLSNVEADGNNLEKIQGGTNWNANASSLNRVANNGSFSFVPGENNREKAAGLSQEDLGNHINAIRFAFHMQNNGSLRIRESGANRGTFGNYSVNDTLKIAVENEIVHYYRNSELLYVSNNTPDLPLLADISFRHEGGSIEHAVISNPNTGSFEAHAQNLSSSAVFQWKVNGTETGETGTAFTETGLGAGDVVTCTLIPALSGCTGESFTSNAITKDFIASPAAVNFFITAVPAESGCQSVEEEVRWDVQSAANVEIDGTSIEKIQGGTNWNAGTAAVNAVHDNGSFTFTAGESNRQKAAGLSHNPQSFHINNIRYGFVMESNGSLRIYESGNNRGTFGAFQPGDLLKVSVENETVHYYRNGELLRVSNAAPQLPLRPVAVFRQVGGSLNEAHVTNLNAGEFMAYAENAGDNPTFSWLINGATTGETGPVYENPDLTPTDVITCTLAPDLGGCSDVVYASNTVRKIEEENPAPINFYIAGTPASSACQSAAEAVQWDNSALTNVAAAGNHLTKIQGGTNWNAGAVSLNRVHDNGSLVFTTEENNRQKAAGLSMSDAGLHLNSIQYAFRMEANGSLRIYESGNNRGSFGSYQPGDSLKISVENGTVHYYRNNELLRVSNTTPQLPLFVDVSMRQQGATISKAAVINLNEGQFTANAENAGENPIFSWAVNGVPVGENGPVFNSPDLSADDAVTCTLTPDLGGCGETIYLSNSVEKIAEIDPAPINFFVSGQVSESACHSASEDVQWSNESMINAAAAGNSLTKIQGGTNWNAGASSLNRVHNNGSFRFLPSETNRQKAAGLSHADANAHLNSIQYAFGMEANGSLRIYESGNNRGTFGNFQAGDTLEIAADNGTIRYFRNSNLLYISNATPTFPLLADVSFRQENGGIEAAAITNLNAGTFTANAENAGDNPLFQWYLNGTSAGENGPEFTVSDPADGDVVVCTLTPDLGGCSETVYTSNACQSKIRDLTADVTFYIQGQPDLDGFGYAAEEVAWNPEDFENVSEQPNGIVKVQSNNNWNGGASSFNTVKNGGYFEFRVQETNRRRAVGLSHNNANAHLNSIQYAFYLESNGNLRIYESGSNRGTFGSIQTGDLLRIAVEEGEIKYYRNGDLLRTANSAPALPLRVDVSIYREGGTVTDATVVHPTSGVFAASASGAGETPQYQWRLNGAAVGNGSAVYTNANVLDGDVITCDITPDFQGCGSAAFTSKTVTVTGPGGTTDWTGAVSSAWNISANWSDGVPDQYRSANIPAGTPHSPVISTFAQVRSIEIAAGTSLSLNGSNTVQVYGNLTVNGAFDPDEGTLVFSGPGTRTVSGNSVFLYRGIANLENPTDSVILNADLVVNDEVLLLSGTIVTGPNEMIYRAGADSRFGSADSYVDGVVRKLGNEAFTFPTGRNGVYAPVTISAPADPASEFTAEYFDNDPEEAGYSADLRDETLTNVGRCEYWMINREFGTSAVSVTLTYGNEQSCGVEDPSALKVARWNGSHWQDHGYLIHEGDAESGTVTSGAEIQNFSPFTIGSGAGINPLPIQLISFEAEAAGDAVQLTWSTASEINNDYFTLERSRDGINFQRVTTVTGAGNSNIRLDYRYTDKTPHAGTSYYRLTQTDFNGDFEQFPLRSVYIEAQTTGFDLYPNPSQGQVHVRLSGDETSGTLRVITAEGRVMHTAQLNDVNHRADLTSLPPGIYIVLVETDVRAFSKKLVIAR